MTEPKDRRYKTIRQLITGGYLKRFEEIFETLPKTVVAGDLGINGSRFSKMIKDVERLDLDTLFRLAGLIEVDEKDLFTLIYNQYREKKPKKRGK